MERTGNGEARLRLPVDRRHAGRAFSLNIQIADIERVFLDKKPARFDLVAH